MDAGGATGLKVGKSRPETDDCVSAVAWNDCACVELNVRTVQKATKIFFMFSNDDFGCNNVIKVYRCIFSYKDLAKFCIFDEICAILILLFQI
jgi:hypothetical protein